MHRSTDGRPIGIVTLKSLRKLSAQIIMKKKNKTKPNKLRKFYLANDFDFHKQNLHIENEYVNE